jgi:predicted Zn-dependent peptidase
VSDTFYDRSVTSTGITVLSERIDTVRSVAIGIWAAVGSRDEAPDEAGMSHFIEHMMFKGTPTLTAAEISETFDRMGAELNAFTGKEYTCYYARVLDTNVGPAIEALSDMVAHSLMAQDACESEREVVLEEISRHEDTPDDKVHDLFASALWGDHPVGRPVLGRRETVGGFGNAAAKDYVTRHYRTGDVVVVVSGHMEHDAIVALVEENLHLPEGPRHDRPCITPTVESRLEVVTKDTEQAHICWGVAGLHAQHPDRFALGVMDAILGGGMSSRLFQEIREKRGLAYAVFSYHSLYLDTGAYTVYAGTRPENTEQVVRLIQAEVERILDSGVTEDELHRAKESIKGSMVLGLESTSNRMVRLGKSEATHGEILSMDELVDRIEAVDRAWVSRVAADILTQPRVLAIVGPHDIGAVTHLLG